MRLNNIIVFEAAGRRRPGFEEEEPLELSPERPNVSAHLRLRGDEAFDARFRIEFVSEELHLIADICAEYLLEDLDETPDPEALQEFAITSGLLHVWPFLRESLRTSASRLGVDAPLLPLTLIGNPNEEVLDAED